MLAAESAPRAAAPAGDVAFRSGRAGNDEIFTSPPTGETATNLTRSSRPDLDPAWSPDGGRVAFARVPPGARRPSIYVMNADGSGQRRVTGGAAADRHPTWSPDGEWLAFVRSYPPQGKSQIWKIKAGGGGAARLTGTGTGVIGGSPVWYEAANGREWIAFSRSVTGRSFPLIRRIRPDGTGRKVLVGDGSSILANPDWAGGRLAVERCCSGGGGDIFTIDDQGSETLVNETHTTSYDEADPSFLRVDPSDPLGPFQIAYASAPSSGGDRDIYTRILDGSDPIGVARHPRADLSPTWQPVPDGGGGASSSGSFSAEASSAEEGPRTFQSAGSGGRKRTWSIVRKVAPGVKLIRIRRPGPVRVFALRVDPRVRRPIDVALAGGGLAGLQRTRAIARRHRALAAINGDFALPGGKPAHAFAEDGDLKQTSFMSGPTFSIKRNQGESFVGAAKPTVRSVETSSGDRWSVDRWNSGPPVYGELAGYTAAGRGIERPAGFECAARLSAAGPRRMRPAGKGVVRSYRVQQAGCFRSRQIPSGQQVVLTAWAGSHEAFLIRSLRPGEIVSLTWSFRWSGTIEGIGGFPLLVSGRKLRVGSCGAPICGRHPRTGIGVTPKGQILLVVVDGRRRKWSRGMTLLQFARQMRRLGARAAMNLDGGGSSTMVVRGKVVNRPSDGRQRPVSSAVLVRRARDAADFFAVSAGSRAGSGAEGKRSPGTADPASTGGFLDAVDRGTFGTPVGLHPDLANALRTFRDVLGTGR